MTRLNGSDHSIIALDRFIQSTRDSGYKTTASAVAELVDNSLQAEATSVDIRVCETVSGTVVAVVDNGSGMSPETLRESLRFGGSSRFNDRSGLGRYGMGLPNASVSQARRVDVYSWQRCRAPMWTYLDVDEIAGGGLVEIPEPVSKDPPEWVAGCDQTSGTVVSWERCDRLDHRRVSTTCRKLHEVLGRVFRYFLWNGVRIRVNDVDVEPVDPLFLHAQSRTKGAALFESETEFEVYRQPGVPESGTGKITVTFSELPVEEWQGLANDEKRRLGISNGAGVSVVRAAREVDFGWFFMGAKRRENYDDWWRCEIKFEPILDEAFGITHTKQQIRPQSYLLEVLEPHMETVARALNGRARNAHLQVKTSKSTTSAEQLAEQRDSRLRPLPARSALHRKGRALTELRRRNAALRVPPSVAAGSLSYRIVDDAIGDACFFRPLLGEAEIVAVVNPKHGFHRKIYQPVVSGAGAVAPELAQYLQLLLLAAARAEATFTRREEQQVIERFRQEWSEILEVMLGGR
jgi:hypothetical protein